MLTMRELLNDKKEHIKGLFEDFDVAFDQCQVFGRLTGDFHYETADANILVYFNSTPTVNTLLALQKKIQVLFKKDKKTVHVDTIKTTQSWLPAVSRLRDVNESPPLPSLEKIIEEGKEEKELREIILDIIDQYELNTDELLESIADINRDQLEKIFKDEQIQIRFEPYIKGLVQLGLLYFKYSLYDYRNHFRDLYNCFDGDVHTLCDFSQKFSPHYIAANGYFQLMKIVLEKDKESALMAKNEYGDIPLHNAVFVRHINIANLLLDEHLRGKVNPLVENGHQKTVIDLANMTLAPNLHDPEIKKLYDRLNGLEKNYSSISLDTKQQETVTQKQEFKEEIIKEQNDDLALEQILTLLKKHPALLELARFQAFKYDQQKKPTSFTSPAIPASLTPSY